MFATSFYESQLVVLSAFCLISVFLERQAAKQKREIDRLNGVDGGAVSTSSENGNVNGGWRGDKGSSRPASVLARQYLTVYAIVMGADWLQGPYVYSLYREQYGFPERVVATLFVTGFLSAGITAPLVGAWADQHGRKRVCQAFCASYTLACACTLFPSLPVLFAGRVLGGLSTSILYSAFESWLVSSANAIQLPQQNLSEIFGQATLVNGFVATAAGIFSNRLVGQFQTHTSPFIASGIALVVAWFVIGSMWTENYGSGGGKVTDADPFQLRRLGHAWNIVKQDTTLLTLGLTQTCFEGSMYLFVFAWVPSLQEATQPNADLPLGYIFSSFMVSMMLGSLLYTCIVTYVPYASQIPAIGTLKGQQSADNSLTLHAKLSSLVCTVAAFALAVSVSTSEEYHRFWAFCLFEGCVGMYYPVQGMLRGTLISNDHRATLSALFRVPLNIFVVVSLMTGVSSARLYVFAFCAAVLALSSVMTGLVIVPRAEETSTHTHRP